MTQLPRHALTGRQGRTKLWNPRVYSYEARFHSWAAFILRLFLGSSKSRTYSHACFSVSCVGDLVLCCVVLCCWLRPDLLTEWLTDWLIDRGISGNDDPRIHIHIHIHTRLPLSTYPPAQTDKTTADSVLAVIDGTIGEAHLSLLSLLSQVRFCNQQYLSYGVVWDFRRVRWGWIGAHLLYVSGGDLNALPVRYYLQLWLQYYLSLPSMSLSNLSLQEKRKRDNPASSNKTFSTWTVVWGQSKEFSRMWQSMQAGRLS